jgi:hypothetical protein
MMKLIQRATNGNYSYLLETTIKEYLEARESLHTVRGMVRAFTAMKSLCAFYDIFVPSLHQNADEADWIKELRTDKTRPMMSFSATQFSELQLSAYMSGGIDYMLESDAVGQMFETGTVTEYENYFRRFLALEKHSKRLAADFLIKMWKLGYTHQKERFERKGK